MTAIPETREGAADIVFAGAGPAGLALACAPADAGPHVRVLDQRPLVAVFTAVSAPARLVRQAVLEMGARLPLFNGFMNALLTVRSGGDGAIPTGRGGPTYPNSKGNSK